MTIAYTIVDVCEEKNENITSSLGQGRIRQPNHTKEKDVMNEDKKIRQRQISAGWSL